MEKKLFLVEIKVIDNNNIINEELLLDELDELLSGLESSDTIGKFYVDITTII